VSTPVGWMTLTAATHGATHAQHARTRPPRQPAVAGCRPQRASIYEVTLSVINLGNPSSSLCTSLSVAQF